jgi:hypothetical protein
MLAGAGLVAYGAITGEVFAMVLGAGFCAASLSSVAGVD